MSEDTFLLDGWVVDVASGYISRGKDSVRLEPQVMKVLVHLADRAGSVVSRDDCLDNLWGSTVVGDAALTRCIFEIRRAFGDNPRSPRIIETIPKIGFRLMVEPQLQSKPRLVSRSVMLWTAAASLLAIALMLPTANNNLHSSEARESLTLQSVAYDKAMAFLAVPTKVSNRNAISMFEKAVALDPQVSAAHAGLANAISQQAIYWGGGNLDDALAAAESALRLAPHASESHLALGQVRRAQGYFDAALESYDAANRIDPTNIDAIYNSADIHRQRLEFGKATEKYLNVLRIDPDHTSAMNRLGFLYLRKGDLYNARIWFDRVISETPMDPYANSQLAALELVTGNTAEALRTCKAVHELYPTNKWCLQILGDGNLRVGNFEEAMHWYSLDIAANTESMYGQLGVAQVFLATNRVAEGLAIVDRLLDQSYASAGTPGSDWSEYWMVAACLALKGDADNAIAWLNRAADAGRRFALWDAGDSALRTLHDDKRFGQYVSRTMAASNDAV